MNSDNRQAANTRITFLSFQVLGTTASRTSLIGMGKKLAELGDHVDFFGIRSEGISDSTDKDIRLVAIPMRPFPVLMHMFYLTLLVLMLPFYIAVRRPDFVILEPKFGSLILALESKLFLPKLRPRLVLDIRSTPVAVRSFRNYLGELAFNVSIVTATRVFDGITLATNQMKEEVCREFQLNSMLTRVWHNGVDVELFQPQKFEGRRMRKRLGLSDEFVVFYHGAFRQNGGVAETIKSIQVLKRNYPNLLLFLLGAGPALGLYKNLIRESKIEDKVVIHKPVEYSEVPKYIAIADVGIVPLPDISDWRNQSPLKLIEYLAMGKTVIVTDIPANRELIGKESCGIYLTTLSPEAIAQAIQYAYSNREKLKEWGASGRAVVRREYDWKIVAQRFENYLREVDGFRARTNRLRTARARRLLV